MFFPISLPSRLLKTPYSLCALLSAIYSSSHAVELEQLHLPRTYLRYLPQLYDGAQLMEQTEKCHQFVKGGLKIDASDLEAPVFSYTCRDSNNLTYRWVVDGLSLEILDDTRPQGRISFAGYQNELEQQRQRQREREQAREEELARLQAEREAIEAEREKLRLEQQRASYWPKCKNLLSEKTKNMQAVEWQFDQQPEVELLTSDEGGTEKVRFIMDFNAQDYHRQTLEYRAFCDFIPPEDATIEIHPRALVLPGK